MIRYLEWNLLIDYSAWFDYFDDVAKNTLIQAEPYYKDFPFAFITVRGTS